MSSPAMNADDSRRFLDARKTKREPIKALRALGRLIRDKDDTTHVFEIMRALAGPAVHQGYERMLRTREGGRQAYAGKELAAQMRDRAWLESFAPGSVGAAYLAHMDRHGFTADGLAEVQREVNVGVDARHPVAWYARRLRDVHDVWHVLTGYDTDALGEACLVAFSYAQTRQLGFAVIGWGAARAIARSTPGVPARRAVFEAWRNGRRAEWLPAQDYEALLAEPLEDARARLNIAPPSVYRAVPEDLRRGALMPAA